MKLHILTLNWNAFDKLELLKSTLQPAVDVLNCEWSWYIKDNGSTDQFKQEDFSKWKNTEIFKIGHNRDSFSKGVNFLLEKANPGIKDLVLLLNNDVEFADTNSLKNMIDILKNDDISVVGARLLYKNSNKLQHAGVIFGPKYGNMPYHFRHGEESDDNAIKNRYFQAVTAACCIVRASDLIKIGGFSEKYNWAFDDINMCLSIGNLGKKIAYCGQTKIFHEESASLKKNPVNKLFLNQNVEQFKKDWFNKYDLDHEKYLKNNKYNII